MAKISAIKGRVLRREADKLSARGSVINIKVRLIFESFLKRFENLPHFYFKKPLFFTQVLPLPFICFLKQYFAQWTRVACKKLLQAVVFYDVT
ncbi:TPA: hypothetical protein ACPOPN_000001, partial [Haemophilus influenzae]